MENLPYRSIKRVLEITDQDYGPRDEHPTTEVNRLLKDGWILLDIQRRVHAPNNGAPEHHGTVYILGHTLPDDSL